MANPFDQFDEVPAAAAPSGGDNPFDQFDEAAEAAEPARVVQTRRGARKVGQNLQNPDIYQGLPEETKQKIIDDTTRSGRGSGNVINERRRLANLERLRIENPVLAGDIESMSELQAIKELDPSRSPFVVGVGKSVDDVIEGVGRLTGSVTREEALDPEYDKLASIKSSAAPGEFAGNVAMFAVPGSAAAKIPQVGARVAASSGIGAIESGLGEAGRGGTAGSIAASTAIGAGVGGALAGGAPLAKKLGEKIAGWATSGSAAKQEIKRLIESGSTDKKIAKYMLDGAGKVKSDPAAKEAIRQGFDESVIAAIKGASASDKKKMAEMVKILSKGRSDARYAAISRPSDIIGDSIVKRYRAIEVANRSAASRLDDTAKSLKGQRVDFSQAMDSFLRDLDGIGVKIGDDLTPKFVGSDIEKIPAAEKIIKNIVNRMKSGEAPDAYDIHRLKKYIDENVSYGKSARGLAGKTETILKRFRKNLDASLDENFPAYKKVNDTYSETIDAMNEFSAAAGSKFNPASENAAKQAGVLSRRLLSNVQSRSQLMDALDKLQTVANKYSGQSSSREVSTVLTRRGMRQGKPAQQKFDDDILTQVLFADELSAVFKPSARTSLQGDLAKEVQRGARAARGGATDVALDAGATLIERARGLTEENALKAIERLLQNSL